VNVLVLVAGSRSWDDPTPIRELLSHLPKVADGEPITVMHGAARGADALAGTIAKRLGYGVTEVPADWEVKPDTPAARIRQRSNGTPYDAYAGIERNLAMLDHSPDLVIAFIRGASPGTSHVVAEARRRGLDVLVTRWEEWRSVAAEARADGARGRLQVVERWLTRRSDAADDGPESPEVTNSLLAVLERVTEQLEREPGPSDRGEGERR
jgi:SLOG family YspA-like protein